MSWPNPYQVHWSGRGLGRSARTTPSPGRDGRILSSLAGLSRSFIITRPTDKSVGYSLPPLRADLSGNLTTVRHFYYRAAVSHLR
jgi:hypothetical protein